MSTLWAAVAQPLMQELWRKSAQKLWKLALSMYEIGTAILHNSAEFKFVSLLPGISSCRIQGALRG